MINTILLDLDGTLLQFSQEAFIGTYFTELKKVFAGMDIDPDLSVKAVWAGTKAMISNDGSRLNAHRFWETFAHTMRISNEQTGTIEAACDSFYINEFDAVRSILKPNDITKPLVHTMVKKRYCVVLATNPLFPLCAVSTRLKWAGLELDDFQHITHYTNSTYCKPSRGYYSEIFLKINKNPEQCLMAGNNPSEDMVAAELGSEVFLVTDYLENEADVDITAFRRGTLAELGAFLTSLPDIN